MTLEGPNPRMGNFTFVKFPDKVVVIGGCGEEAER
jgi:hypothetical protein